MLANNIIDERKTPGKMDENKISNYSRLNLLINELDILLNMKLWKPYHPEIIHIKELFLDELSKPQPVLSASIMLLIEQVLKPIFSLFGSSEMKSPYEIENEEERERQHVKNVGERIKIMKNIINRDIFNKSMDDALI